MTSLRFLPNSPTLGNAGRAMQQLVRLLRAAGRGLDGSASSRSLKDTALIHQSGGGTGFAFSRLRPAGDIVASTGGVASGPVSFMRVYDAATESIKQGGTRRGANMAILSVDHPDIEAFINVKSDMTALQNFNISVAVTEGFMQAVERDDDYDAHQSAHARESLASRSARAVFRQIVANAWRNGDPGLVFLDRINRDNPTPAAWPDRSDEPVRRAAAAAVRVLQPRFDQPRPLRAAPRSAARCATPQRQERPPGRHAEIDWDALAEAIPLCVRFLDDVIEQNKYPIPPIDEMTRQTRKIGLGVMGWADLLFALRIRYDSDEAIAARRQA